MNKLLIIIGIFIFSNIFSQDYQQGKKFYNVLEYLLKLTEEQKTNEKLKIGLFPNTQKKIISIKWSDNIEVNYYFDLEEKCYKIITCYNLKYLSLIKEVYTKYDIYKTNNKNNSITFKEVRNNNIYLHTIIFDTELQNMEVFMVESVLINYYENRP